jgi:hypothetical protein
MGMMTRIGWFFALTLVWIAGIGFASPVSPEFALGGLPDTSTVRQRYLDAISGPLHQTLAMKPAIADGLSGPIRVSVGTDRDYAAVLFSVGRDGSFSYFNQGSYRFLRRKSGGAVIEFDVFLRSRPDTYARVYPSADRAKMDLVLLGRTVSRAVVVSLPFDRLIQLPFSRIVEIVGDAVDWSLFSPDPVLYADSRSMIRTIRERLPRLRDADDGAMDSAGRYVFIETGEPQLAGRGGFNCSGFAKWVADGIYEPITGKLLDIGELKEKHPDVRGNGLTAPYEDSLDPYFGLDWTRNIARALASISKEPDRSVPSTPADPITSWDITDEPGYRYQANVGFPVAELGPLLYMLAVKRPQYFYLASINGEYGNPRLPRHFHVVVLFPYFTETGEFRTAVFEREAETSLESLARRYPAMSAHLVGIETALRFDPPQASGLRSAAQASR